MGVIDITLIWLTLSRENYKHQTYPSVLNVLSIICSFLFKVCFNTYVL